ncbi:hypothetical protein IWZ03DRAFT_375203 [Phyllosticta citriasiana]|uniref:Uncharacterized protein n=1 Tax=Phyllosticta citriasiana TaxID=595635 RepID=A0ABR1KQ09_9PEZI
MIKQASKQASIATCHLCIPPLRSCLLVLSCLVLSCLVLCHSCTTTKIAASMSSALLCAPVLPSCLSLQRLTKTQKLCWLQVRAFFL